MKNSHEATKRQEISQEMKKNCKLSAQIHRALSIFAAEECVTIGKVLEVAAQMALQNDGELRRLLASHTM